MQCLSSILNRSLTHYRTVKQYKEVVSPAIPIVYFGNTEQYFKSKIKIVTVGKNPSFIEFCRNENQPYSFFRFPKWKAHEDLNQALDSYFENKPYENWFNSYEAILK